MTLDKGPPPSSCRARKFRPGGVWRVISGRVAGGNMTQIRRSPAAFDLSDQDYEQVGDGFARSVSNDLHILCRCYRYSALSNLMAQVGISLHNNCHLPPQLAGLQLYSKPRRP